MAGKVNSYRVGTWEASSTTSVRETYVRVPEIYVNADERSTLIRGVFQFDSSKDNYNINR